MTRSAASHAAIDLLRWLGLALLILVVDQFTKLLILAYYHPGESSYLMEFLNIVRVHNRGAAFSFLAAADGWQRWLFVGIGVGAALLIIHLLRVHAGQRLFCFALTCIMGGAVGNVLDRLLHGYVVDMVDFHIGRWHFPAFNFADTAITFGVIFLLLDELLRVRRARAR